MSILLAPFDFTFVSSPIRWIPHEEGIQIIDIAAVRSDEPPQRLFNDFTLGKGFTLEAWVRPQDIDQRGPARIVSYSKHKLLRNFTLGQDGTSLVFRLRTTRTNLNGKPQIVVEDVFQAGVIRHLVVTYDYQEQRVFIDGKHRKSVPLQGDFANWDPSFDLLFANEATGNRPWRGELYLVVLHNQALSQQDITRHFEAGQSPDPQLDQHRTSMNIVAEYQFRRGSGSQVQDLSNKTPPIDAYFVSTPQILGRTMLASKWADPLDLTLNIALFLPLGWFIAKSQIQSKTILATVFVIVFVLTFSVEILQYYALARHSSIIDVGSNVLGAVIGFLWFRRKIANAHPCHPQ